MGEAFRPDLNPFSPMSYRFKFDSDKRGHVGDKLAAIQSAPKVR